MSWVRRHSILKSLSLWVDRHGVEHPLNTMRESHLTAALHMLERNMVRLDQKISELPPFMVSTMGALLGCHSILKQELKRRSKKTTTVKSGR